MSNPLYQQLNPQINNQGIQNQYQLFMQNPVQFLASRGYNVPMGIQNDPKAIIQNMLNNGMISQGDFNAMLGYLQQSGMKFS